MAQARPIDKGARSWLERGRPRPDGGAKMREHMRLDLGRIWAEASAMLRANRDAVSGIAGMFILMPGIISAWALPDPAPLPKNAGLADMLDANSAYVLANWPLITAAAMVVAFGSLSLLALLIDRDRPTVGQSLRIGLATLPFYMLGNLLQSFIIVFGLMLLVVPGLYLIGRFICLAPVVVAERTRRPLDMLRRSAELTRHNGWRLLLLLGITFLISRVVLSALRSVVGILAALLLPVDIGRLALIITSSLVEAVLAVVVLALSAAIYRQALVGQA